MYDPITIERFWARVHKRADDECWAWTGARYKSGHGYLTLPDRKQPYAHRISWELHYGPIPSSVYVCQRCKNTGCVNPHHLYKIEPSQKMRDAHEHKTGAFASPEQESRRIAAVRKFSIDEVETIRSRYALERVTALELAQEYGVSHPVIGNILNGKSYQEKPMIVSAKARREARNAAIIEEWQLGKLTVGEIAKKHSVSMPLVYLIIRGTRKN